MVKTTEGGVHNPKKNREPHKETTDDRRIQKALNMTEEEWGVVLRAANSRSTTPVEALRIAIRMTYGDPPNAVRDDGA